MEQISKIKISKNCLFVGVGTGLEIFILKKTKILFSL